MTVVFSPHHRHSKDPTLARVFILCYNTILNTTEGALMYALHLLNDGDEWEVVAKLFKTARSAKAYYITHCQPYCFDVYKIVKMQ